MSNFNPLIHETAEKSLTSMINLATAALNGQDKQIAQLQALCDHFGDQLPILYQVLQGAEGTREVDKVLQQGMVALFDQQKLELQRLERQRFERDSREGFNVTGE